MKTIIFEGRIYEMVSSELCKARNKFPDQKSVLLTLAALTEEIGELNQSILHHNFQPEKGVTEEMILKEGIQSIVMIIRVLLDANWLIK